MTPHDVASATLAVKYVLDEARKSRRDNLVAGLECALVLCEARLMASREGTLPPDPPTAVEVPHPVMAPSTSAQPPVAAGMPAPSGAGPIMSHHTEPLHVQPGSEPVPPTPFMAARAKTIGSCPDCGGQLAHAPNCGTPKAPAPSSEGMPTPSALEELRAGADLGLLPGASSDAPFCCTMRTGHPGPHEYRRGAAAR
jgi:hypothetical protein